MKSVLTLLIMISTFVCRSQSLSESIILSSNSTSEGNMILLSGKGTITSNTTRTIFLDKFIRGGKISKELKSSTLEALKESNIIGISASGGFTMINNLTNKTNSNTFIILSYQQKSFNEGRFNKELADILLNGNSGYLGKTIELKNTSLNLLNYSTISIGFIKKTENKTKSHTFAASLGYNIGLSNTKLQINSGQLSFAEDGSAITLQSSYSNAMSDTSNSRILNGNGACVSLLYQYTLKNRYSIRCAIEDYGVIYWNKDAMINNKNTDQTFEGIDIEDIANIENLQSEQTKDSIFNTLYYPKNKSSYATRTPFTLSMAAQLHLSKQFSISGSVWQQMETVQNLGYQIKPIYAPSFLKAEIAPFLYGDGYNNFNYGLEFVLKSIKNLTIKTDIYSLQITHHTIGGAIALGYKF